MRSTLVFLAAIAGLILLAGCLSGGELLPSDSADPANASPSTGGENAGGQADGASSNTTADRSSEGSGDPNASSADPSRTSEGSHAVQAPPDPEVTVAVVDTGINLYHEAFAAAEPADHDLANATPIELSLGKDDYRSAVQADWDELSSLQSGKLYTFPGTKVLGAVSFLEPAGCLAPADQTCQRNLSWPRVLDDPANGTPHGTWTASRVVQTGSALATGEDVRIVMVQVQLNGTSIARGFQWVDQQPWIDAVSVSLYARNALADRDFLETLHSISHEKPVFVSAGNGVGGVGVAPKPDWAWDGLPDVVAVGGVDNDRLTQWSDMDPYVAADACGAPLAVADGTTGTRDYLGGTSFAAPYAAGAGARLLLEAREVLGDHRIGTRTNDSLSAPQEAWSSGYAPDAQRVLASGSSDRVSSGPLADGTFTLRELKDVLYHTAHTMPTVHAHDGNLCRTSAVPADAVPERGRFPYVGYGEVSATSLEAALEILDGRTDLPQRSRADQQYERAHELRALTTQHQVPLDP